MIKSLLIGLGSFVVIGALVWMGSQTTMSEEHVTVAQEPLVAEDDRVNFPNGAPSAHAKNMVDTYSRVAANIPDRGPSSVKDLAAKRVDSASLSRASSTCEGAARESCDDVNLSSQATLVGHTENLGSGSKPQKHIEPLAHADFEMPHTTDSHTDRAGGAIIGNPEEDLAESSRGLEEVWDHAINAEPIAAEGERLIPKGGQDSPRYDIFAMSAESESKPGTSHMNVVDKQTASDQEESTTRPNSKDGGYRWDEIGIRGGFNAEFVAIPPTEKENFEQFDIFGSVRFPKQYYYDSGWEIYFRMNGSLGALRGDGELGFIGTVSPGIVFWYPAWNISINGGPGLAYVSREKYGRQDLGGPIQIVGQGGLTYYVTEHIGIGWRFHHISDAGIWGSDNRGVDVNLFELTYKF
ncbi:acyloxyacyl hydrolase [Candidatus Nitrospira salsa]